MYNRKKPLPVKNFEEEIINVNLTIYVEQVS